MLQNIEKGLTITAIIIITIFLGYIANNIYVGQITANLNAQFNQELQKNIGNLCEQYSKQNLSTNNK